jgi:hypothetical protein
MQFKHLQAIAWDGSGANLMFGPPPDECPRCGMGIEPKLITATYCGIANTADSFVQVIYQCPKLKCQELFISNYAYSISDAAPTHRYGFSGSAPKRSVMASFPDSIVSVSPAFVEIFNQALTAESAGLDQISGIGLRKAIEFLIKDFLIHENPASAEAIKSKFLGTCIKEDITDANIKGCAERATWLANDETHYVRKWVKRDIADLKTLIQLTVNWVDSVLLTQKLLRDMDPSNPTEA